MDIYVNWYSSSKSFFSSNTIRDNKSSENIFNYNVNKYSNITDTINTTSKYNSYDDDKVMKAMQSQIPKLDTLDGKSQEEMTDEDIDKLITLDHWKTIRTIMELQD